MRKQKRKTSDEESSEMDVDAEEKMDQDRDGDDSDAVECDDDDEDDDEMQLDVSDGDEDDGDGPPPTTNTPRPVVDNPFMDSFYGLAASDPQERALAAQCMLQQCLLGPSANSKDAAYAFRRMLNGLCSGRAAARQGNASALASFLKIAFRMGKMEEIREEANDSVNMAGEGSGGNGDTSLLAYVRQRLLDATDPKETVGGKRASEEKDHQFGRLFGILGVVRSNILSLPSKVGSGHSNIRDIQEVAVAMSTDLVDLFWLRRWMREPAAHGIVTMLKLFLDQSNDDSKRLAQHIIDSIIVPKTLILSQDRNAVEQERMTLLGGYCAEQIGIAAYIQSRLPLANLSFPLDEPIVCKESIPWLGDALSETSSVVQPRTHFVWDALWCYMTETSPRGIEQTKDSGRVPQRRIRETIPLSDESGVEILDTLMRFVLEEKLLHLENGAPTAKTTHERRSLALCIVKTLSGVPFVSSINGPNQILLEGDALETILLTPDITRTLFLSIICSGSQKQKAAHVLKPLALDVLGLMTKSAAQTEPKRRLAFARSLLNSDVRFDSRTKTSSVADLLGFSSDHRISVEHVGLWNEFLDHVEYRLLQSATSMDDSASSTEANGFVELLYGAAKIALRPDNKDENAEIEGTLADFKLGIVKRILGFYMAAAFFDCSKVTKPRTQKKKGKRSSKSNSHVANSPVLEGATKVNSLVGEGKEIPYAVRSIIAMRFFSLTSEFAVSSREPKDDEKSKVDKVFNTFSILAQLCDDWKQLESTGAKTLVSESRDNEDAEDGDSPLTITEDLRSLALKLRKQADGAGENSVELAKKRCGTGMAVLAMSLYLHRLSCGTNNSSMDEDPNVDLEEDEEEISSALEGLKAVSEDFFETTDEESNPLLGLAEICSNILSSPLGSGDVGRGSSPKLLREAVKYAWLGGLRLASSTATEEKTLLDTSVIDVLLEAVGANDSMKTDEEEDDSDGSENEGDDDDTDEGSENDGDEDNSTDGRIFTKASKLLDDPEAMPEDEDMPNADNEDEDDSDVEIDASKLQTMLEQDVDEMDDEDILEHHEGADGALAKLIKMKQEARKSGQQAREKIEVSNQVRCTLLIELLLGRTDGWNRLFRRSTVLAMVLPLLNRRTKVTKMLQKAVDSGSSTGRGEKRALLDRLTVLIKQKLCKLRLSTMPPSSTADLELAATLVRDIMKEARQSKDKEIGSCCSSCVIFVLRIMPSSAETVDIATQPYGELVTAWSTKRSSGAFLFDDLIAQMPVLAQAVLAGALNRATQEARSTFVKGEAYRLLSLLFATKPSSTPSELETLSLGMIHDEQDDLLSSVVKSLQDKEMSKPKRARGVLKMMEKLLPFLSAPLSGNAISYLKAIKAQAQKLVADQGDKGMKGTADKLVGLIDDRMVELKSVDNPIDESTEKDDTNIAPSEDKKAKKKSNKKKKR